VLGHATPTFFDSTVGYPSDSLASCLKTYCRPIQDKHVAPWTASDTDD